MKRKGKLAIIAGTGRLPAVLAAAAAAAGDAPVIVEMAGSPVEGCAGMPRIAARIERLGRLFADLRDAGVHRVALAGGMRRPTLERDAMDAGTAALAPRILPALRAGDDGLLRLVIAIFEEEGFAVVGAATVAPGLTAAPGLLAGPEPGEDDRADAARAIAILAALGPLDLGQGAVVAQGQCLGIETVQGTDAMLAFVAETAGPYRPDRRGGRGVLVKLPKPGQDLRVDMPAIGPETVRRAAEAGLGGIVIAAGKGLILDRAATLAAAEAAGLFLWARDMG